MAVTRALTAAVGVIVACACAEAQPARVGSKSFTESYLIAEIIARLVEQAGEAKADRRFGLGGTGMIYRALETGEIDVYPEYTGTISRAILNDPALDTLEAIRAALARRGLVVSAPLGFENTYALAVREDVGERLGLRTISDLGRHSMLGGPSGSPQTPPTRSLGPTPPARSLGPTPPARSLRAAFTSGFLERDDGWPGLRRHYGGLVLADVRAIEHALAYPALASGQVDVIDAFSTDGRLTQGRFRLLQDDRKFFPSYAAVLLARRSFVERAPRTWAAIERRLAGRIDTAEMTRLNARIDLEGVSIERTAAEFLGTTVAREDGRHRLLREVLALTLDHLGLVGVSLAVAILAGIPLGIVAARYRLLGQLELISVGVVQTIPSLALLCFMIPLFGIGKTPALVALSLYALLPIVRGAYTGLITLDRQLLEIAGVLGLSAWQRLVKIELPLASVSIMAGIKTAAVVTVGTATLAAFIGGGGYGDLIVRGLALNDVGTILAGAIPAALMALVFHAA
ncbi:MAG TPA: glycine betaine ABC transporter substrate-binding protein, partial [Candidatus Acidoferrum sp.]|nr:glycine betaine ABC transporter substrate-binding protein [Candidatus Acidoferrum sp.]